MPASPLVFLSPGGAVRVVRALYDWFPESRHEPGQSSQAKPEVSSELSPASAGISAGGDDIVVVVESDNIEKNRQFVERVAAKMQEETNLFRDIFYQQA